MICPEPVHALKTQERKAHKVVRVLFQHWHLGQTPGRIDNAEGLVFGSQKIARLFGWKIYGLLIATF